jgi:CDGSH-type Zn-finger protein
VKKENDRKMATQKENRKEGSSSEVRIKVCKNGPYLVSGEVPIAEQTISCDAKGTPRQWIEGEKYLLHKNCSLCRCGQSGHKPFCDGTHVRVKFDGRESASRQPYSEQAKKIDGSTLELNDAEILCASARFCHRGGEIWGLIFKTEEPETRKTVIANAGDCPSGRLVVRDRKTERIIEPRFEKSVGLVEDPSIGASGPIWLRGGIPVESADGKEYETRNRVTLCRCGKSANKPFCDSSHYPEDLQEVKSAEQG